VVATTTTMNRDEYIERYRRLSLQSDLLRQRLSRNNSSEPSSPIDGTSPSSSPVRRTSTANQHYLPYSFPSAHVWPTPQAVPAAWKAPESEQVDEANLYEINHQIKALLTELLNCDAVKHDKMYRAWVQARLMDAEHELKTQRRRRSSVAQDTIRKISMNLGLSPVPAFRASF